MSTPDNRAGRAPGDTELTTASLTPVGSDPVISLVIYSAAVDVLTACKLRSAVLPAHNHRVQQSINGNRHTGAGGCDHLTVIVPLGPTYAIAANCPAESFITIGTTPGSGTSIRAACRGESFSQTTRREDVHFRAKPTETGVIGLKD